MLIGRIDLVLCVFFFKQKTAYEMRISDWSSDVCSSDLSPCLSARQLAGAVRDRAGGRPPVGHDAAARQRARFHRALLCAGALGPVGAALSRAVPAVADGGERRFRSEEHTSELQSLMRISYAVFCLKKKKCQRQ